MASASGRRPPADKYDERRRAIAESATRTLGELGYARASLREIANNSDFSHGVVHYYFKDKHDLIVYCVRELKTVCVRRYDGVVADSRTPDELVTGFADELADTLKEEASMHRLWYDVRSQSMFEERLRDVATEIDGWLEQMIWRIVSRYAELAGAEPALPPSVLYGILDGLFQQALIAVTRGHDGALDELRELVHQLLPTMIRPSLTT
ncbi:TetR/AcrR family transcriptional regulator [Nocardioides immobilis]|uniref:TetR/AcrR family transcriptional regulator n=1 Tax=Nocardioides immobilis TaxID=2049295 RepID=A0A417XVX2_9ACTN|nr:TetR/AcrR family transcriptional regulator [Nocardioides immobilis]RHW24649.1 TetR/AcrR family transcriptional regulator [Nocardioides immobilis]